VGAIAAGIVTFNPGAGLRSLCEELLAQECTVLIHDNASTAGIDVLAACEALGAIVHRSADNTGVAGGLAGLLARVTGTHDWLATFDQDSGIEPGFIAALASSAPASDPGVAVVAPRVIETASGATVQGPPDGLEPVAVVRVITSGALCRVAALNEAGGVREDLFIDYVDYDLCLRLRRAGWEVVVVPAAVLYHSIGAQTHHRLLGVVAVHASNHSPDRQYYKYRNYVLLARDRTLMADPRSAVLDGAALLWQPLKIALFERNRLAKLRAMAQGVAHGVQGRTGSRPAASSFPTNDR